jgi:hypothetical protein
MAENSVEHHPPSVLLLLCPLAWFTRPFTLGLLRNTEATFSAVWAYNPYQSSVMDTPSRSVTANINGASRNDRRPRSPARRFSRSTCLTTLCITRRSAEVLDASDC